MHKRIIANNRIRAREVRLIDDKGQQLGVFPVSQALAKAREAGLDLIQITEKVDPPVCKIMEYGKYAYLVSKKERKLHQKSVEMKSIRLTFAISDHDLQTRARAAEKFLNQGHKVMIEMRLKGRQKALGSFARKKINKFLSQVNEKVPLKIERELKRQPRGMTMLIAKR